MSYPEEADRASGKGQDIGADSSVVNAILAAVKRRLAAERRWPVSTYRLQFTGSFTFRRAATLVGYLGKLGITHCYASPYLKARPGSPHGYDICDHNSLNPEIGSAQEHARFVHRLQRHGMGHILDFVPNHMSIFDNPWWQDVLENGPSSPYARFFDIDWDPVKPELHQKVLLPILEDLYGKVVERGDLCLRFDQGAFEVTYHEHRLPVDPKTVTVLLEPCLDGLRHSLGEADPDYIELHSIITACHNLPGRNETDRERASERRREKEVIKRRLWEVCRRNREVQTSLDDALRAVNGVPEASVSFDQMHRLLEAQAYRLSYWRVASEEINYRRFFDINELAAIRMEDPLVFEESHRLVLHLFGQGMLSGIRLDHADGLFDPADYLWRLQGACFLELCWREVKGDRRLSHLDRSLLQEKLLASFEEERRRTPGAAVARPLFVVVEKILVGNESLRETWPVHGTTGYEYATVLNGLFVDRNKARSVLNTYRRFTGSGDAFRDLVYQCKDLVMRTSMSGEVNELAHSLNRVSEQSRWYRDFTLNSLRDAIREVIASFPVYRTYINAPAGSVERRDRAVINAAIAEAKRRNPAISAAVFDFVRDTLLLRYPPDMSQEGRGQQHDFVMRFQQYTGPVMAKGMEDTAFYIYNPLVSLNEVGGSPGRLGASVAEFHQQNIRRHQKSPHSLVATSTHDSKRSEDVRARINVLSEIPGEWRSALSRWARLNRRRRTLVDGEPAPDRNEEYLLYQSLLGTHPLKEMTEAEVAEYCDRIQSYMLKAIREAKVHTSWVNPNVPYEEAVQRFVSIILNPSTSGAFLPDLTTLARVVAVQGMYNSLSQALLKLFSPGVPDIYQGNELWDFSLVDPDSRRPVDFARRIRLLDRLAKQVAGGGALAPVARRLVQAAEDGRIKLFITHIALTYRRDNTPLFDEGTYIPLEAVGPGKDHVCAFAWRCGARELVVAAPRLVAALTENGAIPPTGRRAWGDSALVLSRDPGEPVYANIFTGETVGAARHGEGRVLPLSQVFSFFPVAAMELIAT